MPTKRKAVVKKKVIKKKAVKKPVKKIEVPQIVEKCSCDGTKVVVTTSTGTTRTFELTHHGSKSFIKEV